MPSFLNSKQKLVDAVVDRLCEPSRLNTDPAGAPSLAHLLVVVPTAEAGRRLRRALAVRFAADGGRAVVPPLVMTPPVLVKLFADAADARDGFRRVSPAEAAGVLARILSSAEAAGLKNLLPAGPAKSFPRALSLSKSFLKTLDALGEDALSAADVALDDLKGKDAELNATLAALDEKAKKISAAKDSSFTYRLREKWSDMAKLEKRFFEALRSAGLRHANESLRAAVETPLVPARLSGVTKVVLPALADAIPVLYKLLGAWCAGENPALEVFLRAPGIAGGEDEGKRFFDEWGCPLRNRGKWLDFSSGPLAVLSGTGNEAKAPLIHRSASQWDQAEEAVELLFHDKGHDPSAPPRTVALAMLDPELEPSLAAAFAALAAKARKRDGSPTELRSPSLKPLSESSLGLLFSKILAILASNPDFGSWNSFLRLPDVQTYFRKKFQLLRKADEPETVDDSETAANSEPSGEKFRLSSALSALDEMQRRHLPESRSALVGFLKNELDKEKTPPEGHHPMYGLSSLAELVKMDESLRSREAGECAATRALRILRTVFGARDKLNSQSPEDCDLAAAAAALREMILQVRDARPSGADGEPFSDDEQVALLGGLLSGVTYSLDAGAGAFPALGWLELPWCNEERMVISGFDEGCVPAPLDKDALLPDSLRRALGISCDERRLARDAFVLAEVLACRGRGDVTILSQRTNAAGEARLPSRLLFACPDAELAARVAYLFREPKSQERGGKPSLPENWRLTLPTNADRAKAVCEKAKRDKTEVAKPEVSVTAFKDYLASPFGYYLKTVLEWDPDRNGLLQREIPPNDFGTLCHDALEAFGRDESVRDEEDEGKIYGFLEKAFAAEFKDAYGPDPAGVLQLQRESCLARLRWFAGWQSARRKAGWHIRHAEVQLRWEPGVLGPLAVKGRADRVDQHDDGRWQILDYKTWAKWDKSKHAVTNPKIPAGLGNDGTIDPKQREAELRKVCIVPVGSGNGKGWWTDLQLPLYVEMAKSNGFWSGERDERKQVGTIPEGAEVTSGYLVLGDSPDDSGLVLLGSAPASSTGPFRTLGALELDDSTALAAAVATAKEVVRRIDAGIFLPIGRRRDDFERAYAWRDLNVFPETADPLMDGIAEDWLKEQRVRPTEETRNGEAK